MQNKTKFKIIKPSFLYTVFYFEIIGMHLKHTFHITALKHNVNIKEYKIGITHIIKIVRITLTAQYNLHLHPKPNVILLVNSHNTSFFAAPVKIMFK